LRRASCWGSPWGAHARAGAPGYARVRQVTQAVSCSRALSAGALALWRGPAVRRRELWRAASTSILASASARRPRAAQEEAEAEPGTAYLAGQGPPIDDDDDPDEYEGEDQPESEDFDEGEEDGAGDTPAGARPDRRSGAAACAAAGAFPVSHAKHGPTDMRRMAKHAPLADIAPDAQCAHQQQPQIPRRPPAATCHRAPLSSCAARAAQGPRARSGNAMRMRRARRRRRRRTKMRSRAAYALAPGLPAPGVLRPARLHRMLPPLGGAPGRPGARRRGHIDAQGSGTAQPARARAGSPGVLGCGGPGTTCGGMHQHAEACVCGMGQRRFFEADTRARPCIAHGLGRCACLPSGMA